MGKPIGPAGGSTLTGAKFTGQDKAPGCLTGLARKGTDATLTRRHVCMLFNTPIFLFGFFGKNYDKTKTCS
jgi:hypothetical protein